MKTKRKRRKSDTIPVLKKKLDKVFSKWVRLSHRDKYGWVKCYTCSTKKRPEDIHAGHYVPRHATATRWHPMNVKPQCAGCNSFRAGEPQTFRENLIEEYSLDDVEALEMLRHESVSLQRDVLQAEIEKYTELVRELEAA